MRKFLFGATALVVCMAFGKLDAIWINNDPHSQIVFTVSHLGISEVSGTFNDFDVIVKTIKPDFSDASFGFIAQTASIDTRLINGTLT
jgi:polyisoprenoid-binding protein YceI